MLQADEGSELVLWHWSRKDSGAANVSVVVLEYVTHLFLFSDGLTHAQSFIS